MLCPDIFEVFKIMMLNKLFALFVLPSLLIGCGARTEEPLQNATSKPVVVSTEMESSQTVKSKYEPETQKITEDVDPILARGKRMFLRCKSCHTVDVGGNNGTGPNIHGMFGAEAATKEEFNYSKALEESGIVWTEETLDAWIEKPRSLVPRTSMAFVGIKKPEDREALIAYLKTVTN